MDRLEGFDVLDFGFAVDVPAEPAVKVGYRDVRVGFGPLPFLDGA